MNRDYKRGGDFSLPDIVTKGKSGCPSITKSMSARKKIIPTRRSKHNTEKQNVSLCSGDHKIEENPYK